MREKWCNNGIVCNLLCVAPYSFSCAMISSRKIDCASKTFGGKNKGILGKKRSTWFL